MAASTFETEPVPDAADAAAVRPCPLCTSPNVFYSFVLGRERFDECWGCGLLFHRSGNGADSGDEATEPPSVHLGSEFAREWFAQFCKYGDLEHGRLGVVGTPSDGFMAEARRRGFEVRPLAREDRRGARYDGVILFNVLERTKRPIEFVEALRPFLRPGGVVSIISHQLVKTGPQRNRHSVVNLRQRFSFSDQNLRTILIRAGFRHPVWTHGRRTAPAAGASSWTHGDAIALAKLGELRPVPRLSIVVPVYNEIDTARSLLDALMQKRVPNVEIEIVVVESNSSDGTRDVVLGYQDRPNVKVVLQEKAAGKGAAVREGMEHASGDIILIQDADLEYDVLDYEVLLDPILSGRAHFVLGTRHAGHWKVRQFGTMFLADILNFGHYSLVRLMNLLYRQSMTDPFTMFKVFHKDCLYGLTFECDLFDFDIELVCKLINKGYRPVEIPVNYQARSFAEGKKIRFFRDGYNCVRAILKYRFPSRDSLTSRGPGPQ